MSSASLAAPMVPAWRESRAVTTFTARAARVVVPDYQLSLAIGKEGQNARLAAKLTGWRIDIRSDTAEDVVEAPTERPASGPARVDSRSDPRSGRSGQGAAPGHSR